jgi:hypothetical protein
MHKYRLVAKKGEGTFSEVLKAQCIKNGKYVAIKCMKVSDEEGCSGAVHANLICKSMTVRAEPLRLSGSGKVFG